MKSKTNIHRTLFFKIGLALSLGLSLVAFEWKSYDKPSLVSWEAQGFDSDIEELPPITEQKMEPPKVKPTVITVVEDEEEVEDDLEEIFDEFDEEETVEEYVEETVEEEEEVVEKADKVFTIVEHQAKPGNFYKFLKKNLKYPRQAKRMGIEGKVFVSFIVDTDGSITNIELVRGIGGGCDEEAIRILKNSPKWEPAKQRGVPVKQRMTFPVRFTLKR